MYLLNLFFVSPKVGALPSPSPFPARSLIKLHPLAIYKCLQTSEVVRDRQNSGDNRPVKSYHATVIISHLPPGYPIISSEFKMAAYR